MRPLPIALWLYIGMMSWMILEDKMGINLVTPATRIATTGGEAMRHPDERVKKTTTPGFDHYIVWTCRHDRTPKEAIRKAEAWAMAVDSQTIDAVNVKQWVVWMQGRPETKYQKYAKR